MLSHIPLSIGSYVTESTHMEKDGEKRCFHLKNMRNEGKKNKFHNITIFSTVIRIKVLQQ